jgi:threonine dehydratase
MPCSPPSEQALPTVADIEDAARLLDGVVVETPLLESSLLNQRLGGRVLLKAECLQLTGSFKVRGASNRIRRLSAAERGRGVVAFSSGNHAQGVAYAAREAGAPATIVMPADAPAIKRANTQAYGAELRLYDRFL